MKMAQTLRPLTKMLEGCAATLNIWRARPNGHCSELPVEVKRFLRRRFVLSEEYIDALRCVTRPGWLNSDRVLHIRVFDPNALEDGRAGAIAFKDIRHDSELVLFSGHISKDHDVHLTRLSKSDIETS